MVNRRDHTMNKEELIKIKIYTDPVLWCKTHLVTPSTGRPLEPYDLQAEILRDPTINKVLRIGRRGGKTHTMIIHMLWQCNIRRHITCLVVAPYDKQVLEIYDNLIALLNASPILKGTFKATKDPYRIKFNNDSRIVLMTAGTKSGAEGGSVRGQDADIIYLDEMDYLNSSDVSSVLGIKNKDPKRVGMWCASTPSGRRGLFYKYCTDPDAGFKEFHYTFFDSQVYKNSSEEERIAIEKELRAQYPDETSYAHEVLAEFGIESQGVFNKAFIDRARSYSIVGGNINDSDRESLWDYYQIRDRIGNLTNTLKASKKISYRTVGVDWDKSGAPTEIVVIDWLPYEKNSSGQPGMFRIIARIEIPQSDFTLTNAVSKIIEINEVFKPDFIYVDRGYGENQVELLHLYGKDHPESGLQDKVKGISFQSKVDVRDPYTGKIDKKHMKPFMVNNAVHIFDSDLIQINNEDVLLWRQLENYQIVSISVDGRPTYSKKDEHALDAMNLALLAMTLEFPNLSKLISEFKPSYKILKVVKPDKSGERILGSYKPQNKDIEDILDEKMKNCYKDAQEKLRKARSWQSRGKGRSLSGRKSF